MVTVGIHGANRGNKLTESINTSHDWNHFSGVFLFVNRAESLSATNAALGLGIFYLGITPGMWRLYQDKEPRSPFPLLELTGLFYALFFGISVFLVWIIRDPDSGQIIFFTRVRLDDISIKAMAIAFAGLFLLLGSWAVTRRQLPLNLRLNVPNGSNDRLRLLFWGIAIGALIYAHSPLLKGIPSIGQFLTPAGFLGFGAFCILRWRGELPRWEVVLYFFIILPLWLLPFIVSGFSTSLVLVAIYWAALGYWHSGRLPWRLGLSVAIILFAIYPSQAKIRQAVWDPAFSGSIAEKLHHIGQALIENHRSWERYKTVLLHENGLSGITNRIAHAVPMSIVVDSTPDKVPYWRGETYKPLLTSWIPRAVWKNKPEERAGGKFGLRYGFMTTDSAQGSMNIPWNIEMYANFGIWGVLIGSVIVGIGLGTIDRIFNSPNTSMTEGLIGSALVLPIFYQDSNISVMMGTFVPLSICYWLYFRVGLTIPLRRP